MYSALSTIDSAPSLKAVKSVDHTYVLNSDDTPRKLKRKLSAKDDELGKLRKKLKMSQQKNRRLGKKVKSLNEIYKTLQQKHLLSEQSISDLKACFSPVASSIIERHLKKCSGKLGPNTYPPDLRTFALTLQFHSSRAYDYVRRTFSNCLPHPDTLSKWYRCMDGNAGFSSETFEALAAMSANRGGTLTCSLMMDEIAIRKQLDWDGQRYVGYVDMGTELDDSSGLPLAKEALVFMIVALKEYWKMPVGYFLIDGLGGDERANLVRICVQKLQKCGVHVVSLTFDGCSANSSMIRCLGASLDVNDPKPFFDNPADKTQKIGIFYDACHMLKLMRNLLAEKHVLIDCDGGVIKWEFIKSLHELQSTEGLRAGNKLHERHIQWMKQKMKVKLAAQTLSSSVADSLEFCMNSLKLSQFKGCEATIKFIRIIDRLFHALNSRNPLARGYKSPLKLSNEASWRSFLHESNDYLRGLKLSNNQLVTDSLRRTGVVGFVMSTVSLMMLFDSLVKQQNVLKYILAYKFSQDHLELFFGVIRSRGGCNNNPSAVQFKGTWKRLLAHLEIKESAKGNCIAQDPCRLLTVSSRIDNQSCVDIDTVSLCRQLNRDIFSCDDTNIMLDEANDILANNSIRQLSTYVENVVVYVAGFVVKSLLKRVVCDPCREQLIEMDSISFRSQKENALFNTKNRGGLQRPSRDVVAICKIAEAVFKKEMVAGPRPPSSSNLKIVLLMKVLSELIGTNIFEAMHEHALETSPLSNHATNLAKSVASSYITIRLHHQAKVFTRFQQGEKVRSVLNKTVIF